MSTVLRDEGPVYDLLGVGFGPSNLALAIAVSEHNAASRGPCLNVRFLERQKTFGWHRGMLIDDATMQVSFLKDLVTMRNPASDFSFLCYLHERGRLADFINHKTLFPLRMEFHDYFCWAAERVGDLVRYDTEVTAVRPVVDGAEIACFEVHTSAGKVYTARNLAMATGLVPSLPEGIAESERVWHNSDLLYKVDGLASASRFVVLGAGQSAAETTALLHDRFPDAEVCAVFSRSGYSPSDDSPFANRVFDPETVDEFHDAPPEVRKRILDYHSNTNYSVVDLDLIEELYRRHYREKVLGVERLRIFRTSRITELAETDSAVRVTVESLTTGTHTVLDADALVCATGYRPSEVTTLLGDAASICRRDDEGRPLVARDYRLLTTPDSGAAVYVQGGSTEHTHGITSSLLSNNAVRAQEILDSVVARVSETKGGEPGPGTTDSEGRSAYAHEIVGMAG